MFRKQLGDSWLYDNYIGVHCQKKTTSRESRINNHLRTYDRKRLQTKFSSESSMFVWHLTEKNFSIEPSKSYSVS